MLVEHALNRSGLAAEGQPTACSADQNRRLAGRLDELGGMKGKFFVKLLHDLQHRLEMSYLAPGFHSFGGASNARADDFPFLASGAQ